MQKQENIEKETLQYNKITKEVLNDFALYFGINKKTPSSQVKTRKKTEQPLSEKETSLIQKRLDRLEKRIQKLDETKAEYTEERVALEQKKLFLKNEKGVSFVDKGNLSEKEKQLQEVKALLNKKSFGYVAPVMSPVKEEEIRLKNAQNAAFVEKEPIEEKKETGDISDKQLQKASDLRNSFIAYLQTTNKKKWYSDTSQNRDRVNEYVIKTAAFLSGKNPSKINMDDIQTSRLFLFKGAPENLLKHPAFSYVESFYNYQNNQGHSGNNITSSE